MMKYLNLGFLRQNKAEITVIPRYYREKARNFQWLLMFILSRFMVIRRIAVFSKSLFNRLGIPSKASLDKSLLNEMDIKEVVDKLESDGVCQGFQLPKSYVKTIFHYACVNECYVDRNPNFAFKHDRHQQAEKVYQRSIMRGEYLNVTTDCPIVCEIAKDPQIIEIAAKYLKTKPVLMETRLWWNFPVDEQNCDLRKGARTFHYDLDDYRCVVFFFYLTDVDLQSGPHVCVRGSHKRKKLKYLLSLNLNRSDAEIVNYYGRENMITIQGKAGSGFVEDKFIYHKGTSPVKNNRLLLYLQFGINNYRLNRPIKLEKPNSYSKGDENTLEKLIAKY